MLASEVDGYEGYSSDGFVYRDGRRHHRWAVRPYPPDGQDGIGITRMWPCRRDDLPRLQQLVLRCESAMATSWDTILKQLAAFVASGITEVAHRDPDDPLSRGSTLYTVCRQRDRSKHHDSEELLYSQYHTAPITDLVSAIEASAHLELGALFHRMVQHHRSQCFRLGKAKAVLDLALRHRIGAPMSEQVYMLTVCGVPHIYATRDRHGDGHYALRVVANALPITRIEIE